MLYSVLLEKGETVSSFENIDSTFNVPSTILKCTPNTKYLVLELGVEYVGDMDFYLWLVKPDIGVITNIHQTHTLFFGNVNGVAREKGKLVSNLSSSSIAILNSQNDFTQKLSRSIKSKVVLFGKGENIFSTNIKLTFSGTEFDLSIDNFKKHITFAFLGEHFVTNALAVSAVANSLGFTIEEIKSGLEKSIPPKQRMNIIKLKSGAILIDDTYNNNPTAARASFKTVKSILGQKKLIVVFGEMRELGHDEVERHKEIGSELDELGASFVIGVGNLSKHTLSELKKTKSIFVESVEEVLPKLKPLITKNSLIFIKGARGLKLENLVLKLI